MLKFILLIWFSLIASYSSSFFQRTIAELEVMVQTFYHQSAPLHFPTHYGCAIPGKEVTIQFLGSLLRLPIVLFIIIVFTFWTLTLVGLQTHFIGCQIAFWGNRFFLVATNIEGHGWLLLFIIFWIIILLPYYILLTLHSATNMFIFVYYILNTVLDYHNT